MREYRRFCHTPQTLVYSYLIRQGKQLQRRSFEFYRCCVTATPTFNSSRNMRRITGKVQIVLRLDPAMVLRYHQLQ